MLIFYIFLLLLLWKIPVTATQTSTQCGIFKCWHNALCSYDGMTCQCRRGYKGEVCQYDFNECEFGDPCYHRGHCRNTFGSWRCDCLEGWRNAGFQEHCEMKTNPDINFRKCIPGWMGEWCQDQCLNNGMCNKNQICKKRSIGKGLRCVCSDGWSGADCTSDIDECTGNPCKSFQICINTHGSYTCVCPAGWKGNNCSEDMNECLSNPCKHSGSCVNTNGSYICSCTNGRKGTNCEVDMDGVDTASLTTGIMAASVVWSVLLFIATAVTLVIAKHKWDKSGHGGRTKVDVVPAESSKAVWNVPMR